jgi:TatD DNase family protein
VRELNLPLFLHERNCDEDFIQVFNKIDPKHELKGCVHSFTGSKETAKKLLDMGFHIGFNGSGMRTEESLEVIRSVPLNRILIETGN